MWQDIIWTNDDCFTDAYMRVSYGAQHGVYMSLYAVF